MTGGHDSAVEDSGRLPEAPARGWRVRGYRVLGGIDTLARSAADLVEHCVEGLRLGLLRPRDVERIVFDSYAAQPDFYDPSNYQPPFGMDELELAQELRALAPGNRLLDAFCGQGREARAFAEAGFDVVGIDRLQIMIDRATRYAEGVGFAAQFIVADFDSYQSESPFDVVYTSTWMYSTVQTRARRLEFLRQCRRLCAPGGLIVISYKTRSPEQRYRFLVKHVVARIAALLTRGNRSVELGDRLYYGLFWHHFDEDALNKELRDSGLTALRRRVVNREELVFCVVSASAPIDDSEGT